MGTIAPWTGGCSTSSLVRVRPRGIPARGPLASEPRELSRSHPDQVARFVEAHPELSAEAARMATAGLRPGPYRRR